MGTSGDFISLLSNIQDIFIDSTEAELDPGYLFLIGIIELIIGLLILWLASNISIDDIEGGIYTLSTSGSFLIVSFVYEIIMGTKYLVD